jgi:hypothetical protein
VDRSTRRRALGVAPCLPSLIRRAGAAEGVLYCCRRGDDARLWPLGVPRCRMQPGGASGRFLLTARPQDREEGGRGQG